MVEAPRMMKSPSVVPRFLKARVATVLEVGRDHFRLAYQSAAMGCGYILVECLGGGGGGMLPEGSRVHHASCACVPLGLWP